MAHFAELDENNVVLRVVVVNNSECEDENGQEQEQIGALFCHNLFGGRWVQTSYNRSFRKNFAGIGSLYDKTRDAFIPFKAEAMSDWVLDEATCDWVPPFPAPSDGKQYHWDFTTHNWELVNPVE